MALLSAINERKSIRGFTSETLPQSIVEPLLEAARMAPSASNQQPWNFVVVTGETRDKLAHDILAAYRERSKHYDPSRGKTISRVYMQRTKKLLKGMRPYLKKINQEVVPFLEEGSCTFYGAPVLILVTMDKSHPHSKLIDIGCAVENIVLAAHDQGLGTCMIALILIFEELIKQRLGIPESMRVVLGIALGYPNGELPVNEFRAPKEGLGEMTRWIGFD